MKPVTVIGLGLSREDLTAAHLRIIEQAEVLVGGRRHLALFPEHPGNRHVITRDIDGLIERLRNEATRKSVVVLASGDPLFFGIGARMVDALGQANVTVLPNISTVSAAYARLGRSWHDAKVISLHGRMNEAELRATLVRHRNIAVFTDAKCSPDWLGRYLTENGWTDFELCVLEQLGTPQEKIRRMRPAQAAVTAFESPNLVILKKDPATAPGAVQFHLGMGEADFFHEKGLITKAEVRAITLSKLQLDAPGLTLWDLGAGCGSIAVEATLFLKFGRIFAVEKNPDRLTQIRANIRKFGIRNITPVEAALPEKMETLPDPDRVFIGGGGRDLPLILKKAADRLKPGGVMVVNTVLIPNLHRAMRTLTSLKMAPDVVQIQVNRSADMPWGYRLQSQNPIWIISGTKSDEEVS